MTRNENKPDSLTVKRNKGVEKVMIIKMIGKVFTLGGACILYCTKRMLSHEVGRRFIVLILCFCSFATVFADDRYEDKVAVIDGVEYFYMSVIRSGGNIDKGKCVLGKNSPQCAINISDDRKLLCIPRSIKGKQVVKIEEEACRHLVDIEEIVLPVGINEIGENAFRECWSLKKINIPSTVRTIGGHAFKDCEKLESISLPENVKIGLGLFENCSSLKRFHFPNRICAPYGQLKNGSRNNGVPKDMFKGCTSLTTLAIPSDFTKIGAFAFAGCSGLIEIDIPSAIVSVGDGAFRGCQKLETINLPESVAEIGGATFTDCISLKAIKLPYRITEIEGGSVSVGGVFGNCKSLTTISIPENVKKIGMYAFLDCSSLQTVSFSPGIQKIRVADAAFSGCKSLKEIILPRNIADSVLNTKVDYKYDSKKLRELPGLRITYLD